MGTSIVKDLSGGLLGKITSGASILGMFIIGSLVQRWVSISFTPVVSTVTQSKGAFIDWNNLSSGIDGVREAITQYDALGSTGLNVEKVTTLQQNLDQLIPGLAALLLTLLCCWLLKQKGITDHHYHSFIHRRYSGTSWRRDVEAVKKRLHCFAAEEEIRYGTVKKHNGGLYS